MTEIQLTEIRNCLLSKKLPIDILLEVQDHFVSQIQDLMREENLSFEGAFGKAKENWREEFRKTFSFFLSNEKMPKIVKRIYSRRFWHFVKKSILFVLPVLIFWIISARTLSIDIFQNVFISTFVVYLSFSILILLKNHKAIKKIKLNKKSISHIYHATYLSIISGFFYCFQIILGSKNNSKFFFEFVNFHREISFSTILGISFPILVQIFILTNIYMFLKLKDSLTCWNFTETS